MTKTTTRVLWAFVLTALGTASSVGAQATFTGLGDLPGGGFASQARAVSADGSVVVGVSDSGDATVGDEAFRWENGVMVGLGGIPACCRGGRCLPPNIDPCASEANGVSADGSVIVGASGGVALRWQGGVMTELTDDCSGPIADIGSGTASAVSADGSVIVGSCGEAFRWTELDGAVLLGTLSGGTSGSSGRGVSTDGSVVVGSSSAAGSPGVPAPGCLPTKGDGNVDEAFRWEDGVLDRLGDLPRGAFLSEASAASADGAVVAGSSQSDLCSEAFRWEDGVMTGLGSLPGAIASQARAVSADGSLIVGEATFELSPLQTEAFLWNETDGIRSLASVLMDDFGIDLSGWTLTRASGISADRRTIVGEGVNPSGFPEGWIAVLPQAIDVEIDIRPLSHHNVIDPFGRGLIPVAIFGSDDFDVAGVDATTLAFGPAGAPAAWVSLLKSWDLNHDDRKDLVSYHWTHETGITMGDTKACLTGKTLDGIAFEGCDAVLTEARCGHGFDLAFLMPACIWARRRRRVAKNVELGSDGLR